MQSDMVLYMQAGLLAIAFLFPSAYQTGPIQNPRTSCDNQDYGKIEGNETARCYLSTPEWWKSFRSKSGQTSSLNKLCGVGSYTLPDPDLNDKWKSTSSQNGVNISYFGVCPCKCPTRCEPNNSANFIETFPCSYGGIENGPVPLATTSSSHSNCYSSNSTWLSQFYQYPSTWTFAICEDDYNFLAMVELVESLRNKYSLQQAEELSVVYYGTCPCNSDTLCDNSHYFSASICPSISDYDFISLEELSKSSCVQFVSPYIQREHTVLSHNTPTSSYKNSDETAREQSKVSNELNSLLSTTMAEFEVSTWKTTDLVEKPSNMPDSLLSTTMAEFEVSTWKTTDWVEKVCDDPGLGRASYQLSVTCFQVKTQSLLSANITELCGKDNYDKVLVNYMIDFLTYNLIKIPSYKGICPCKCASSCKQSSLFTPKGLCPWFEYLRIPAANLPNTSTSTTCSLKTAVQSIYTARTQHLSSKTSSFTKKRFIFGSSILLSTTERSNAKYVSRNTIIEPSPKPKPDLKTTFIHGGYTTSRHFSSPTKFYDRGGKSSTAEPKSTFPNILHSTFFTTVESALRSKKTTKTPVGSKQKPACVESTIALPEKDATVTEQGFAQTGSPSFHETTAEHAEDPAYISMAAIESTPNEDGDENEPTLVPSEGSSTSVTTISTSKQDWHGILTTILRTERQGFSTSKQNFSSATFSKSYPTEATTTKNFSETPTDHTALRKDVKTSNYNHVYESSNHSTTYENFNTPTNPVTPTEKQKRTETAAYTTIQMTSNSYVAVPSTILASSMKVNKAMISTLRDDAASTSSSDSDANFTTSEEMEHDEVTYSTPPVKTSAETKSFIPKGSLTPDKKSSTEFVTATKPEPSVHASSANVATTLDSRGDTSQMTSRTSKSSQESSLTSVSKTESSTYSNELITGGAATSIFSSKPRMSSSASSSTAGPIKENVHMGSSTAHASYLTTSNYEFSGTFSSSFPKSTLRSKQYSSSKSGSSEEPRAAISSRGTVSSKALESSVSLKATRADRKNSVISTMSEMAESESQRMLEMDSTENSFEPTDSAGAGTSQTASATYRDMLELSTTAILSVGQWMETFAYTPETTGASSNKEISTMPQIGFTIPDISEGETSVNSTASGMVESESQRMMEKVTESSFESTEVAETSQIASATYRDKIELSTTANLKGDQLKETFAYTPETSAAGSKRKISAMPQIGFTIPDISEGGTAVISTTFEMAESEKLEYEMMEMDFTESSSEFFGGSSTEATLTSSGSAFASIEQESEFTNSAESEHKTTSLQSAITFTVTDYREASTKTASISYNPVSSTLSLTISSPIFSNKETEEPSESYENEVPAYGMNNSASTIFSTKQHTDFVSLPMVSTITTPSTEHSIFETMSKSTPILSSPLPHSESLSVTASIQPNLQTTQEIDRPTTLFGFVTSNLPETLTSSRKDTTKTTLTTRVTVPSFLTYTSIYSFKEALTTWSIFSHFTTNTSTNVSKDLTATTSVNDDNDMFPKRSTGTEIPSTKSRRAELGTAWFTPLHGHLTTESEAETSTEWSRTTPDYCEAPCPPRYEEGPEYCYRILPAKNWSYRRAYRTCQEENSMMADETDLRNPSVLELVDFLREIMNPVPELFYVNEQDTRSFVESASVRIVSRSETSRFHLAVVNTATLDFHFSDVYALCRTTKYCADMYCDLRDYEFYETAAKIILPSNHTKLGMGEEISVSCNDDGVLKTINVTCSEMVSLLPHPTYLNCSLNELSRIEAGEVETSFYSKLQKSCEDCHEPGTSECTPVEGGYLCTCKPNWTGFTCWKSPNQCLLQQLQCGPGGMCISEVDRAYCSCFEGYGGFSCETVKENLSFTQNESSVINAASAGAAAMTAGEIFVMVAKGLTKLYFPKIGKDTQVYYQNLRTFVLSITGLMVLLFHHPSLFDSSHYHCTMWFYLITTLYSLGIGFFAMEAINVWKVTHLERKNFWRNALDSTDHKFPRLSRPTLHVGILLGGFITTIAYSQYYEIATPWSCLGHFTYETSNFWLPIVLVNACAALTASYYAYISLVTMRNIPQYREKMNDYLSGEDFVVKWSEEKCCRNAIFLFFQPWLLFLSWLTLAVSSDWITDPAMNILADVFSILYCISNLLQSIITDPSLYSCWIWCAIKYLPEKFSPTYDPVLMYNQSEVRKNSNMKQGQWKTKQRHPGYLPVLVRNRLSSAWMRKYAKEKTENKCKKIEARYAVYIQEADRGQHQLFSEAVTKQIRILSLQWMLRTKRRDPQTDPIRTKQRELSCLLEQLSQVISNTKVLRRKMEGVSASRDCPSEILEEYKTLFACNPFQACTLAQVGPHGNARLTIYSRLPIDVTQIEARYTLSANEEQNQHESSISSEKVDRFWMLRKGEKAFLRIKNQNDVVWEMAKQNSNFIALSMAL